jgi:hypothetical protein
MDFQVINLCRGLNTRFFGRFWLSCGRSINPKSGKKKDQQQQLEYRLPFSYNLHLALSPLYKSKSPVDLNRKIQQLRTIQVRRWRAP